ncbi:unnamed protein product [Acidithrix sp. C25]|nr:unnamed protein product [Acidithrix sp. C25]
MSYLPTISFGVLPISKLDRPYIRIGTFLIGHKPSKRLAFCSYPTIGTGRGDHLSFLNWNIIILANDGR